MKAWVYRKQKTDEHNFHIFPEEIELPPLGNSQVRLKVEKVSVCGTDETLFKGELKRVPDGIIPGHEFYGEIVELGKDVHALKTGQKIAGESHYQIPGIPDQGIIGLWGPEVHKGEMLPPIQGAYAEYMCIPAECAHPVPDTLVSDYFWPSLFEAIGNDYYLIKHSSRLKANRIGIFGCGPHGLFAQVFARYFGIPKIAAFETDPFRRNFACNLQAADQVFNPAENMITNVREFTDGNWFDFTIDMVGKQGQAFQACCETTKDGGAIFLFGLFTDRFAIEGIQGNELIFKMKSLEYEYKGKRLHIEGITGREGIWEELIDKVCRDQKLQQNLMKPVHVMGPLDNLRTDTHHPRAVVLKRAYHAFQK